MHQIYEDLDTFTNRKVLYLSILRDPLDWFHDIYYSNLAKYPTPGPQSYHDMPHLDEGINVCVEKLRKFCTIIPTAYLEYFSGTISTGIKIDPDRSFLNNGRLRSLPPVRMEKMLELAKIKMERKYVAIGFYERQNETAELFSHVLPGYFQDFPKSIQGPPQKGEQLSTENAHIIKNTILKYHYDLYEFGLNIFNQLLATKSNLYTTKPSEQVLKEQVLNFANEVQSFV